MSQPSVNVQTPSPFRFARSANNDGFSNRKSQKARAGSGLRNVVTPSSDSNRESKGLKQATSANNAGRFKPISRNTEDIATKSPQSVDRHAIRHTQDSPLTRSGRRFASTDQPAIREGATRAHRASESGGVYLDSYDAQNTWTPAGENEINVDHAVAQARPVSRDTITKQHTDHFAKRRRVSSFNHTDPADKPENSNWDPNHAPEDTPSIMTAHRFTPATTLNFSPTAGSATTLRPRFVLPSHAELRAAETPLPDAFSPHRHRRGQERYVTDGWASQVRNWVFDAAASTSGADDDTDVVTVEDLRSASTISGQGGMVVVNGTSISSGGNQRLPADVLLIGEGMNDQVPGAMMRNPLAERQRSGDIERPSKGSRVKLGPPIWTMDLPVKLGSNGELAMPGQENWKPRHSHEAEVKALKPWTVCAGWTTIR